MPETIDFVKAVTAKITSRFGRCSKCMRTAFIFTIAAVMMALVLSLTQVPSVVPLLAWSIAALALGLWVAHVWAFTVRSANATAVLAGPDAGETRPTWTRRRLLGAFVRVLVFSAVTSAIPRTLLAQECNCHLDLDCFCPPDFPQCVYNVYLDEAICCGPGATGCVGYRSTWCCDPGTDCFGLDSLCSQ
jgi:magnesium-transporting ATPase (P-type)